MPQQETIENKKRQNLQPGRLQQPNRGEPKLAVITARQITKDISENYKVKIRS